MVVYPDGVWYRLRYPGSPGKRLNQEHKIRQYGGGICIFDPTYALKLPLIRSEHPLDMKQQSA